MDNTYQGGFQQVEVVLTGISGVLVIDTSSRCSKCQGKEEQQRLCEGLTCYSGSHTSGSSSALQLGGWQAQCVLPA